MIETIDRQLMEWILTVIPDADVSLLPPEPADDAKVWLHLMEVLPSSPASGERRPPLQIMLRYLVTTCASDPETTHRMLGNLIFAAMEHPDYEIDLEPVNHRFWLAFDITPRPTFSLRLPLRLDRVTPDGKRVKTPMEIKSSIR